LLIIRPVSHLVGRSVGRSVSELVTYLASYSFVCCIRLGTKQCQGLLYSGSTVMIRVLCKPGDSLLRT